MIVTLHESFSIMTRWHKRHQDTAQMMDPLLDRQYGTLQRGGEVVVTTLDVSKGRLNLRG